MVISRIAGGLGNQMFQYAAGLALAGRLQTRFELDLSWYSETPAAVTSRPYLLDRLSIAAPVAAAAESRRARGSALVRRAARLLGADPRPGRATVARDEEYFDLARLRHRRSIYLVGYWQSEKYFADAALQVKREVLPAAPELRDPRCICVHVRRGDYVSNPRLTASYGLCGPDYYERARRVMEAEVPATEYVIFSDDPDWAAANVLRGANRRVASGGLSDPVADLTAMIGYRHFIIANSSFGWWAAWLAERTDSVIIAPQPWFLERDREDTVPSRWRRTPMQ